jgi:hypothetical protein
MLYEYTRALFSRLHNCERARRPCFAKEVQPSVVRLLAVGALRMQAYSAADLISPAIQRTRLFLFHPFRWSTFLKLCLVSVLTEGFSGNFNVPSGGHSHASGSTTSPSIPTIASPYFGLSPMEIALIAGIVIFSFGLCVAIFYLITRLRFALFHCLVYQTREIRPGWELYDAQSWRFFLLSVAVGFAFLVTILLVAAPFVLGFYRLVRGAHPGSPFNIAGFLSLLLPLIPIIILVVLAGIAIHVILHDLMLPHMALENASAGEAWHEVRMAIADEKGGFLLFTFFRVVLPMAATIAAAIAIAIPFFLVFATFGLSAYGIGGLIANASGATAFFLTLFVVAVTLIVIAVAILLGLCVGGPIGIATRYYALLFYGGRYTALGDLLSPPLPPAAPPLPGDAPA